MKTLSALILLLVLAWSFDAAANRWDYVTAYYHCRYACDRHSDPTLGTCAVEVYDCYDDCIYDWAWMPESCLDAWSSWTYCTAYDEPPEDCDGHRGLIPPYSWWCDSAYEIYADCRWGS